MTPLEQMGCNVIGASCLVFSLLEGVLECRPWRWGLVEVVQCLDGVVK